MTRAIVVWFAPVGVNNNQRVDNSRRWIYANRAPSRQGPCLVGSISAAWRDGLTGRRAPTTVLLGWFTREDARTTRNDRHRRRPRRQRRRAKWRDERRLSTAGATRYSGWRWRCRLSMQVGEDVNGDVICDNDNGWWHNYYSSELVIITGM